MTAENIQSTNTLENDMIDYFRQLDRNDQYKTIDYMIRLRNKSTIPEVRDNVIPFASNSNRY